MEGLFRLLLACLFSVPIYPIFLPVLLLNEIVRLLVSLLLLPTRYRLIRNGHDNTYHAASACTHKNMASCFTSFQPIDIAAERRRWNEHVFGKNLHIYGKLMWTFTKKFGYGCLRDDSGTFDISTHVRYYEDDPNGNKTEAEFLSQILPKLSENMPDSRPQWEWLIIPNVVKSDGRIVHLRVYRCHHGYMDGVSAAVMVTENIMDYSKTLPEKRPPWYLDPRTMMSLSSWKRFQCKICNCLVTLSIPFIMFRGLVQTTMSSGSIRSKDSGFLRVASDQKPKFAMSKNHVDLKVLKYNLIKGRVNMDTLLATAIKRALIQMAEEKGSSKAGDRFFLVNRGMPFKGSEPGNNFTFSYHPLRLSDDEPLILGYQADLMTYSYLEKLIGRFPYTIVDFATQSGSHDSFYVSNIPFVRDHGYICGNEVVDFRGWSTFSGKQVLAVFVVSYGGRMFCSLCSRIYGLGHEDCMRLADNIINNVSKFYAEYIV